jgi:hypothetical protein
MSKIFLSHSRKDKELVDLVKRSMGVMSFQTVVYEDLPDEDRPKPDWNAIKEQIQYSDMVFLFITSNVSNSQHTTYWVNHEVSLASAYEKPLIVFQLEGDHPELPIGYWTDIVSINPGQIDTIRIQEVAKSICFNNHIILRAAGGAAAGSIFGPVGAGVGAVLGLMTTPKNPLKQIPDLICDKCGVTFRYWGKDQSYFHCPHCFTHYRYVQ